MNFIEKIKDIFDPFGGLFKVAGIAGICIGILLIVFKEIIRKSIFPSLTKLHAYKILRLIIICTFSVAIIGIIAYVFLSIAQQPNQKNNDPQFQQLKLESKGVILTDSTKKKG